MMTDDTKAIHGALRQVAGLGDLARSDCSVTKLGGLTNQVYRVDAGDGTYVVRIAGRGTSEYIDRRVELHNARAAARAGVSAEVLWADPDEGVMVSRYIDSAVTMTPELFRNRKGSPARAGRALRKLHTSGETFEFRFELFAMIEEYLSVLSGRDIELPDGYHDIVEAAQPIKRVLSEREGDLAPCHCDPLCENFLDDGSTMWIVDWEYSGMNDPLWDLGDLSVEAGFDADQDAEMMHAWIGAEPSPAQMGRMVVYKAMCDLLWTLWGLIQHADGNPAEDFWAYSIGRFERCKALMQSGEFSTMLDAVEAER